MEKDVKLKDIADKMQVSIVTVSNALAGRSGVSAKLRKKIEKTAEEMGYQRKPRREKLNPVSKKLYRSGLKIGVVVLEGYVTKYASFYWELYQRLVVEASKTGCFVLLEILNEDRREDELPLLIKERQVDALIALGNMKKEYLQLLYRSVTCPMLMLDTDCDDIPCDAVVSNGFFGTYQLTNYLIGLGHTRLAYVGECLASESIMDRYQGFSKSLLEHGIEEKKEWVIADRDLETRETILKLPDEMPTAFVCNSDFAAEQLARLLTERGCRIPQDISLVGYDDFLAEGMMKGKLTTYAVDMDAMAHQSLKLLMKRLAYGDCEKTVRTVDGKLVIRESAAKRQGGNADEKGR